MNHKHSKKLPLNMRWALILVALISHWTGVAPTLADDATLRLRIAWGGTQPVQWAARLSIAGGELSEMSLLGRERDTPGSLWINDGSLLVAQPRPRTFDGVDITARAPLTASLRVEFLAAGASESTVLELPLAELMTETHRSVLSSAEAETNTTLLIHRVADDAIRVQSDRDHLIFDPGEKFAFDVSPAIAGLAEGSTLDLNVRLLRDRNGIVEWEDTIRVNIPADGQARTPVSITLPNREGVYSVRLKATLPPGNRAKFWETTSATKLAERTFQLVVLAPKAPRDFRKSKWKTLLEINPANPKWYDRLPDWTRIDRLARWTVKPMGSGPTSIATVNDKSLVRLPPSTPGNPTWQSYPLPAAEPGLPHVVEIELPTNVDQELVLKVYETDESGKLISIGGGSGVFVESTETSDNEFQTHRYLFYPLTRTPVAVVQNASSDQPANFGKIRLRTARGSDINESGYPSNERMVAAFYDWQQLIEATNARSFPTNGRPPTDDWQTYYSLAERLATTLELAGYNTAVINVWQDGGSAFDTGDYPTIPVLDFSRLSTGANDLPSISPLELILRVCSRRGIRVVPSLRFNSSLVQTSSLMRDRKDWTLEDFPVWTDLVRRPRMKVGRDSDDTTPHYRIAHPAVASEVQGIVDRLVKQCRGQKAFAGVALEMADDSYLAYPSSEYGITPPRLGQLAGSASVNSETLDGWIKSPPTMLANPEYRGLWHAQRADSLTRLISSLAANLREENKTAELWLLTTELSTTSEYDLRPQLNTQSLDSMYLERGIDVVALEQCAGAKVISPQFQLANSSLASAARRLELNARQAKSRHGGSTLWKAGRYTDPILNPAFAQSSSKAEQISFQQLSHTSNAVSRLAFGDSTGPIVIGGDQGPTQLVDQNHRAALRLMASLTPDAEAVGKLIVEQPVALQMYRTGSELLVTITNDSPWPVATKVTLKVSRRTTSQQLQDGSIPPTTTTFAAGLNAWPIELKPYEIQVHRFAGTEVAATGVQVQLSSQLYEQLERRCQALERRDLNPNALPVYSAPKNTSFELTDGDGLATSWTNAPTVPTAIDGQLAAQLTAEGEPSSLSTDPFPTPPTGELALTASIKIVDLSDDARLRILVEQLDSNAQPSLVPLSAKTLKEKSLERDWNTYQFGVEDLPFDSSKRLRIRFELSGTGEVLIDDVQVHQLVYPLKIYPESQQQVLGLVQHVKRTRQALESRQYRDCLHLLDSYWSRFVIEYLPETAASPTDNIAPAKPQPPAQKDSTPRLTDRVRDWFRF